MAPHTLPFVQKVLDMVLANGPIAGFGDGVGSQAELLGAGNDGFLDRVSQVFFHRNFSISVGTVGADILINDSPLDIALLRFEQGERNQ